MTLVVLGANPSVAQAAATLPGEVVHVQLPGSAIQDGGARRVLTADFRQEREFADFVDRVLLPLAPAAVVSLTEAGLEPAAAAAERLGCVGVPPQVVRVTRDKLKMRRLLEAKAPQLNPGFAAGDDAEAVARLFERHARVVAKPVDGSGSTSVQLLHRLGDAAPRRSTKGTLFEQFVGGREFSVEALSSGGRHAIIGIAEKGTTAEGFVEVSHRMPPCLDATDRLLVERAVAELLDAVGLTDGPTHTEVKLEGDKVTVIETHNRLGGDGIADLVQLTTGIDWRRAALGWAIGEGLPSEPAPIAAVAAAKVFFTAPPGVVTDIAAMPSLTHGEIVDWQVTVSVGGRVRALRSSDDRLGVATLAATGTAACKAAVSELSALQVVTTRPVDHEHAAEPRALNRQ